MGVASVQDRARAAWEAATLRGALKSALSGVPRHTRAEAESPPAHPPGHAAAVRRYHVPG